jgi:peptide deformylase
MAVKTILTEPNQILRQVSTPVEKVGKEEQKLMDDMLETMYAANGIGLSSNSDWSSKKNYCDGY